MSMLGLLLGEDAKAGSAAVPPVETQEVQSHSRAKPTGRKPLPEKLPRVDIGCCHPRCRPRGWTPTSASARTSLRQVERRPASLVVVRVHKPKFVPKGQDKLGECEVLQAPPPELPIERGLAGPALLADTVIKRWQDHLPLHRVERIYGRDGLELARSTMCGWHAALAELVNPLIDAMWADAFLAPYLCADATGVLVQAKEKCRRGHFFVVAAPEKHVLFGYSGKRSRAFSKTGVCPSTTISPSGRCDERLSGEKTGSSSATMRLAR
jgi:transposase